MSVGVDIMLNNEGIPFLLEINRYPSLAQTTPADEVKTKLLQDTFHILQHGEQSESCNFEPILIKLPH